MAASYMASDILGMVLKAAVGTMITFITTDAVTNVNVTNIHNVYNTTVVNNTTTVNRVSYNGGNGGIAARPTAAEEAAAHERHVAPVAAQTQHVQEARGNPELRAATNRGKPPIAATQKAAEFKGNGVVAAREAGAPYRAPEKPAQGQPAGEARPENNRPENNNEAGKPENRPEANTNEEPKPENAAPKQAVHPNDLPAYEHSAAPNTGNAKLDKKYQQQQQKLESQQEKQRQKLQQQQDKEHAQLAKQNANDARKQQVEQRHQQQTQQLQQRQTAAQQKMMQRQAPHPAAHPAPDRH